MNRKEHWENIYSTKTPEQVSWTQTIPKVSLDLIAKFNLPKSAEIIDIGGGDSNLVDHLLDLEFTNITVLDISQAAIDRAKSRLGNRASEINWIVSDIVDFKPSQEYDLWHDRAVFHFLTSSDEIEKYKKLVENYTSKIVLGTFSVDGPFKCSGLEITQYSPAKFEECFAPEFEVIETLDHPHQTPFNTIQNFVFARLQAS